MWMFLFVWGLIAIIFNNKLAQSMMKYYPKNEQNKWKVILKWAYIIIGILLCGLGILGMLDLLPHR
jgi:hypothetical protein